jgi:hypothetical protein
MYLVRVADAVVVASFVTVVVGAVTVRVAIVALVTVRVVVDTDPETMVTVVVCPASVTVLARVVVDPPCAVVVDVTVDV